MAGIADKGGGPPEVNWGQIARAKLHPLQLRIIDTLGEGGEWSAVKLGRKFDADKSNVYFHLKKLREVGIVKEVRAEPVRGSVEHFFVLA